MFNRKLNTVMALALLVFANKSHAAGGDRDALSPDQRAREVHDVAKRAADGVGVNSRDEIQSNVRAILSFGTKLSPDEAHRISERIFGSYESRAVANEIVSEIKRGEPRESIAAKIKALATEAVPEQHELPPDVQANLKVDLAKSKRFSIKQVTESRAWSSDKEYTVFQNDLIVIDDNETGRKTQIQMDVYSQDRLLLKSEKWLRASSIDLVANNRLIVSYGVEFEVYDLTNSNVLYSTFRYAPGIKPNEGMPLIYQFSRLKSDDRYPVRIKEAGTLNSRSTDGETFTVWQSYWGHFRLSNGKRSEIIPPYYNTEGFGHDTRKVYSKFLSAYRNMFGIVFADILGVNEAGAADIGRSVMVFDVEKSAISQIIPNMGLDPETYGVNGLESSSVIGNVLSARVTAAAVADTSFNPRRQVTLNLSIDLKTGKVLTVDEI